jgi:uncharacterized membrane protein SirB2
MNGLYLQIRLAHVICVCCSGGLFALRGMLTVARVPSANHPALRWLSYTIDTCLLTAALMLVTIVHQYPFVNGWLTMKVLLLVPYVALGWYALHRARTQVARISALLSAVLVFLFIASVGWWRDPAGIFHLLVTLRAR